MGKKRAHVESEELEEIEYKPLKRVKLEISSDINEEAEATVDDVKPTKKHKKDKKKKHEHKVKQELLVADEAVEEEVIEDATSKSKKEYRKKARAIDLSRAIEGATSKGKKEYRKKARAIDLSRAKEILDFDEAKRLVLTNKKCGLRILREKRHVTLPYHLIGGNVAKSCDFIAKMTVGKYRTKVRGVVVSVGSVRLASLPRVIDDQNVFHLDIVVTQAVFRPVPGQKYEARVTYISVDFLSALIMEAISISMPIDDKMKEKLKGITLDVDDFIEVKYNAITIKRGICQLKGKFERILRKGEPKAEVAVEASQPVVKLKNKKKTFSDSDDEA
ncbi:hypothetical protein OESDEN_06115 [Oesophagostomum dentatum]|uniref:Uncharacterized protein n=1 Tax=Oesophagostomum dentatum TaxID=61180 RepID=A0A0B1T8Q6_OESDE|nr:hypothetical protein OESDEN_06115 [Oesophagostomum dentatum]